MRITYDPCDGNAIPDGYVRFTADFYYGVGGSFITSSENLITAFRLGIKTGKFEADNIIFVFGNKEFQADKAGRIADWPDGFCDTSLNMLMELL